MKVKAKVLLNHQDLIKSLQKIYNCQDFTVHSAYRMKRMCDGITKEMKTVHGLIGDIQKLDDEEKKKTKLNELVDMEIELKWGPMTKEEFNTLTALSPMDISILENFTDPAAFAELEA